MYLNTLLISSVLTISKGFHPTTFIISSSKSSSSSIKINKNNNIISSPSSCINDYRNLRILSTLQLNAKNDDDDDDGGLNEYGLDEEPLSNGIDSVSWLPSVIGQKAEAITGVRENADILPLFPLGGIVYTPNTNHILNIFEPRYRQMYNDILMNGSKRFVVSMSHPDKSGTFATIGVLFQLEDLREVSEQTNDQVKYICNHKVVGRVKIHKILNPEVWNSRETYLKVEGTILLKDEDDDDENDDNNDNGEKPDEPINVKAGLGDIYSTLVNRATGGGDNTSLTKEEEALRKAFTNLVQLQHDLQEDVRFTQASASSLSVKAGNEGDDTLWSTVRLWQSYTEQRLVARQNELQREFQEKLLKFLTKDKGVKEEELPSAIGFTDLSPALQQEVKELQKRMAIELQPLILESTLAMQKILEANTHCDRLNLLRFFVNAERKRLEAKKTLQGMFFAKDSEEGDDTKGIKKEEEKKDDLLSKEDENVKKNSESTIFIEDPDAFQ